MPFCTGSCTVIHVPSYEKNTREYGSFGKYKIFYALNMPYFVSIFKLTWSSNPCIVTCNNVLNIVFDWILETFWVIAEQILLKHVFVYLLTYAVLIWQKYFLLAKYFSNIRDQASGLAEFAASLKDAVPVRSFFLHLWTVS